ncbi:DUF4184 family protein [Dysgonomonas sp. OttesenSCG-928-D17]|nr:DUF4184 family protein [Dysgonomonas sp. OttesenSCG-928-D17]
MPFTFSHPIAVLPLAYLPKRWVSLTGLIIGSVIPDFEYFLRMRMQSDYSHTLGGVFWLDLPLAVVLAFTFHNIVRDALFDNLPGFLQTRFAGYKQFDWNSYFKKNWIVVIVSVLIGIFSHLLWDSFTHETGWFVERYGWFGEIVGIGGLQLPVFKILQYSSTVLGGLALLLVVWKMPAGNIPTVKVNIRYWIVFVAIVALILLVRLLTGLNYKLYGHVIVNFISALLMALILTPLLIKKCKV